MEINVLQIIFQLINFGVVFGALTYFLTKPVTKMLDDRRTKIDEANRAAEESLREREQVDAMKKKAKVQADKDAAAVIDAAKSEAKDLKSKLSKDAKEEVNAQRAKDMAKIDAEIKGKQEDAEKEVLKLSVAIASKVIGKEVDDKTHKSLISQSIKDLAKAI